MKKLTGLKKIRTAIFISGKGSNFENLLKHSFKKKFPIEIVYVVSNTFKAKGLKFARKFKINYKIINFKNQIRDENLVILKMKKYNVKLICLAGFMKILSNNFIKKFNGKIINIHPSLLPKYKGLNTHKRVIENKEKYTGCTVHFVNSKLDSGKIILQKKIKVLKTDNPKSLAKRVLKQEHLLFPKAIKKIKINL